MIADNAHHAWVPRVLGIFVGPSRVRLELEERLRDLPADWESLAVVSEGDVAAVKAAIGRDPVDGQDQDEDLAAALATRDDTMQELFDLLDAAGEACNDGTDADSVGAAAELLRDAESLLSTEPVLALLDTNGFNPVDTVANVRSFVRDYLGVAEMLLKQELKDGE